MKKCIAIILAIIFLFCLCGCKDFLPKGYDEFGAVKDISYNIYE